MWYINVKSQKCSFNSGPKNSKMMLFWGLKKKVVWRWVLMSFLSSRNITNENLNLFKPLTLHNPSLSSSCCWRRSTKRCVLCKVPVSPPLWPGITWPILLSRPTDTGLHWGISIAAVSFLWFGTATRWLVIEDKASHTENTIERQLEEPWRERVEILDPKQCENCWRRSSFFSSAS